VNLFTCATAGCGQSGTPQYANGNISYADTGDTNINQVGTLGSFSAYAAGTLNFDPTAFIVHDSTLEGLDVSFTGFAGLGTSQIGGGVAGTGFFDVVAGRDINFDGVALNGLIGTSTTPFAHDINLTAGRNIMLGSSIYAGTGSFTIAAGHDINTTNQTVLASTYTNGGNVFMYGNNQIESLGSIDITGRNLMVQGGATAAANPAGNYANPNAQSAVGQQLVAGDTINLMLSGDITVQGGTSTAASNSGAAVSAATINIGSSSSRVQDVSIIGGTSVLAASGYMVADASVMASGSLNIYTSGNLNLAGGTVTGAAIAANQAQASAGATILGNTLVIDVQGNLTMQAGNVNANVPAPLLPTDPSSGASANAIIDAITSKNFSVGGNLNMTGGNTMLSAAGSSVSARAVIDPGQLTVKTGGDITLTGGTGIGTEAAMFGGGPIAFSIGGTTGLRLVGGVGSGVFDGDNARLDGSGYPITIIFPGGGSYKIIGDLTLGDAFIQSSQSLVLDNLVNLGIDSIDRTQTKRSIGFYDDRSLLFIRSAVSTASSCK
jgi:hypothetical protein